VREHYKPRFSGDSVPADRIGAIISVADKIDTLVGCFSLGLIPTGSQDPYALRRQTAGIVQILAEYDWPLKLSQLMNIGCDAYRAAGLLKRSEEELQPQLQDFFALRIKNALAERNIRYDVVDAVMAVGTDQVSEVLARGAALMEAVQAPTFKTVAEALSRAVNIAVKNPLADARVVETLFEDECEASLQRALHTASHQFALALQAGDTAGALVALRALTEPVTLFFERVMVMTENAAVRQNRLSLMHEVAALVRRFADLSKIVWGSAQ
jgi:glycyl-tRNA synthetase beta chain